MAYLILFVCSFVVLEVQITIIMFLCHIMKTVIVIISSPLYATILQLNGPNQFFYSTSLCLDCCSTVYAQHLLYPSSPCYMGFRPEMLLSKKRNAEISAENDSVQPDKTTIWADVDKLPVSGGNRNPVFSLINMHGQSKGDLLTSFQVESGTERKGPHLLTPFYTLVEINVNKTHATRKRVQN